MCFLILFILLFLSKYNILIPALNTIDGVGLPAAIVVGVAIGAVVGDGIVIGRALRIPITPIILFYILVIISICFLISKYNI